MKATRPLGAFLAALPLLAAAGTPTASAVQEPATGAQRSAARVMEPEIASMDFTAIGADGRPVKDLRPSEVVLKVDGRDRQIHLLQYVELGGGESLDRGGAIARPLPQPFASNLPADAGRVMVIAVNHETITPGKERPVRDAAMRFLGGLSPRDRVGLATMPRGGMVVPLTRDHEQVRTALGRISGQAPQTSSPGLPALPRVGAVSSAQVDQSERACTTRLTLGDLATMLEGLASMEEPKTVVFISSGLVTPTRDAPMTAGPGRCEVKSEHFQEVGIAARAARAHLYIVQPSDLVVDPASTAFTDATASRFATSDDLLAGLQSLAGVTSGDIFRLSGQADVVFTQVANESSGYYLADFVPEPSERNDQGHSVEVRVSRPDVKVRHKPRLVLQRPQARSDPRFLSPHDMLRGSRRFRTLPLRAMAFTSRMPEGEDLKVVAVAEPMDPSVAITSAAMALVDSKNRLVKQWTAEKADLAGSTLMAAFPTPAGSYRLRVAAIDAAGRHGTVEYSFVAALESAGIFKMSTIVLGVSRNNGFQARMMFGGEPTALAYIELYGRAPEPVVRFELAESTEGPPLLTVTARTTTTQDPERRIAIGALPISSIFPGDYIVRAVVTNDGRPLGRATRTLRKVVVR
jgi:VWFA-related protein